MNVRRRPPRRSAPEPAPPKRTRVPRPSAGARLGRWRDHHLYGLLSSLGRLAVRPLATVLTVTVLGVALALPLLLQAALDNLRAFSGGLREAREITVFLDPDVGAAAAAEIAAGWRARPDVAEVTVRTPEQGLAEFRQLSGFSEAIEVLDSNPLPSVLVVAPAGAAADGSDGALIAAIEADRRVDLVQHDAAWRRRLTAIMTLGERAAIALAALFGLATLLVVGNTVRLDVQSRAEEIAIMQLMGAGDGFVRRPFLYAGLWYGLLGAVVAILIVLAMHLALRDPLAQLIASYGGQLTVRGVAATALLATLAGGAALGWLGAWLASTRQLRRTA